MGSTSKQVNLVNRLASISIDLPDGAAPSLTDTASMRPSSDPAARPTATTDSCSRGNDNSDASECESDCLFESPAEWVLEDETLKKSYALTVEEVLQRRVKRVRQLMKLYRTQYWGLVEETRTKYRRFYLRHGVSGWRDDAEGEVEGEREAGGPSNRGVDDGGGGDGMREPDRGKMEDLHCGAQGCTAKPLSLSVFCVAHILLEPRQRLYKPCSYVSRTGQNGPVTCGRPVLQAAVPLLCGQHFQQARKQANRSLSKVLPGFKSSPKLHVIISQYVRVIQNRRRHYEDKAVLSARMEDDVKRILQVGTPPNARSRQAGQRVPTPRSERQ